MPHDIVLAILVLASDVSDPSTVAAIDSARTALGAHSLVSMQTFTAPPSDDEAAATSNRVDATVVITWSEDHRRAHLHLLRVAEKTWVDRDIGFDPRDAALERGRTIGFAIATMMPDVADHAAAPPLPDPSPPAPEKTSTPTIPSPPITHGPREDEALTRTELRRAVTASGIGAIGVGGYGGGGGAAAAFEWYPNPNLGLRISFGARAFDVTPVAASAYILSVGLGAHALFFRRGPFELGARADALILWEQVNHLDADDSTTQRQARLLPGIMGTLDVGWSFTESASVVLGAGSEVAFGQTDLYLHNQKVAVLVPIRLISELGFRLRF